MKIWYGTKSERIISAFLFLSSLAVLIRLITEYVKGVGNVPNLVIVSLAVCAFFIMLLGDFSRIILTNTGLVRDFGLFKYFFNWEDVKFYSEYMSMNPIGKKYEYVIVSKIKPEDFKENYIYFKKRQVLQMKREKEALAVVKKHLKNKRRDIMDVIGK